MSLVGGFGTVNCMHVPIFNRLMLLLPLALLTRAWKFFYRNERLGYRSRQTTTHLRENVFVKVSLHRTHFHPKDSLALRRQ